MKRSYSILFIVLMCFGVGTAVAQNPAPKRHHISIENGKVFVNSKQIESTRLPASLRSLDKSTTLQFWGTGDTMFEIAGVVYSVQNGILIERDRSALPEGNLSVYFSSEKNDIPFRVFELASESTPYLIRSSNVTKPMENYVAVLNERAQEFDNIRYKLDAIQEPKSAEIASQLKLGAENMARFVEGFPKVQFEAYLSEIQDANHSLYNTLVQEQQMEMETHRLAMKIREAASRSEQERITEDLRKALNEIFTLKQDNRKQEIEQLKQKLNDLQQRLKEREALREDIVENRIRELLDQYRW